MMLGRIAYHIAGAIISTFLTGLWIVGWFAFGAGTAWFLGGGQIPMLVGGIFSMIVGCGVATGLNEELS